MSPVVVMLDALSTCTPLPLLLVPVIVSVPPPLLRLLVPEMSTPTAEVELPFTKSVPLETFNESGQPDLSFVLGTTAVTATVGSGGVQGVRRRW